MAHQDSALAVLCQMHSTVNHVSVDDAQFPASLTSSDHKATSLNTHTHTLQAPVYAALFADGELLHCYCGWLPVAAAVAPSEGS